MMPALQPTHRAVLTHSEASDQLNTAGISADRLAVGGSGRLDVIGKRHGNKAAAYQWTADGQALHWSNFVTDERGTIFSGNQPTNNPEDSAKLFQKAEERRRKQDADRQELQDLRARQAQYRWHSSVTTGTHPYITLKQLAGLQNARIESNTGALLIPMWVSRVGLVNLQLIYPDGTKRFMTGARVKGAYSVIGRLNGAERVLVCEGWATGASLFELYKSKGYQVVVAFNAGNLMPVCQALRSRFENLSVVIAGDDDRQNAVNTGRKEAMKAAESVGAPLLFPELCKACKCTDHNDVMVCRGRRSHG